MQGTPSPGAHTPVLPTILDIEASGFGPGSYPIEVGFVTGDGKAWWSLVRPEADWRHWDESAAAMHGITREHVERHGRCVADIAAALNERLRGQVVYSDAWAHDYTWLNKLYDAAGRSPSFKLENLRALLDDQDAARWHEVKRRVAATAGLQRHRASSDARLLQQTWLSLRHPQSLAA